MPMQPRRVANGRGNTPNFDGVLNSAGIGSGTGASGGPRVRFLNTGYEVDDEGTNGLGARAVRSGKRVEKITDPDAVTAAQAANAELTPYMVKELQGCWWKNAPAFAERLWDWKTLPDGRINDAPFRPWSKQIEVMRSVRDNHLTCVRSGNGIGKTKVVAAIAIMFLMAHSPSTVFTTSAGWRELEQVLWPEIRHLFYTSAMPLGAEPLTMEWTPGRKGEASTDRWKMVAVASKDKNNFAGLHNARVLGVGDEADGLTEEIIQAMHGNTTGENDRLLLTGNPHTPGGAFHKCSMSREWKNFQISCFMHPNIVFQRELIPGCVTQRWIDLMREELGEGTPAWCARVEGEFPELDASVLIPWHWLKMAADRYEEAVRLGTLPAYDPEFGVLGVDVAESASGDRTVFFLRDQWAVRLVLEARGLDTMGCVGKVLHVISEWGGCGKIGIDNIGIGAGVVDRLKELFRDGELDEYGVEVCEGVCFSESAYEPSRFVNMRDNCAWLLRDLFDPEHDYMIDPKYLNMMAELSIPKLIPHSSGKTKLEKKEDIKKRMKGGRSCDVFDAGAFSCAPSILMRKATKAISFDGFGKGLGAR